MPIIPVSEWAPDASDFKNPGSVLIKNALPGVNSYKPMPQCAVITDALDARCRGAIEALDKDSVVYQYAGDAAKLYELSGSSWQDVSNGGGYSTGSEEVWEFARWKEKILATNFTDNPQQITFGGTAFSNLTTDFRCRHVAVIGDFVVVGNTFDATDGTVRDRFRWSALDDETDWTVSATTMSGYVDLKSGGGIQKIVGGEFGLIVSERSTFRVTFVGSPTVFQIDEALPGVGALAPGFVTRIGESVYFLSEHGFVAISGGQSVNFIGAGKVDEFMLSDLDMDNLHRVSSVADPKGGRIYWAYPGSGNTSGRPNKIIVYDRKLNKWSLIEHELEFIWRSSAIGTTLDALDDYMLGTELVSTGDFASDTNWTKGTGWTISGGTATHAAGTASEISQSIALVEDNYYRVEFDVTGRTAGSVTPELGATAGTAISADDTDIKETIRAGADSDIAFSCSSDFDGSIDNVSVKEINDMDELIVPLDSSQWKGGSPQLGLFTTDFKAATFTGTPMTATVETKEVELYPGRRTQLNAFRPLVDGGTVSARVKHRNSQSDAESVTASLSPTSSGRVTKRVNARYHRFELTCSGSFTDIIGVQVEPEEGRKEGRR